MSCTKRFADMQWERHHWRNRVTGFDTVTAEEPDMWARPVFREYVRCEKEQVCHVCGTVRHQESCMCEPARAERCKILLEFRAKTA